MATKIVTKNSSTASAVPTASDLVQGELAVNVADKRLFTEDNGGSIIELGTNPSTIDINAGSIDGTAIGASSASTGAFTTLTATGLTVDTNTLYVDSTNNRVGIGTTSPSANLDIESSNATLHLTDSDDNTYAEVRNNGGTLTIGSDVGASAGGSSINFKVDNTERMRIDSSGLIKAVSSITSDPTDTGAYWYNKSGVGPTLSGYRFSIRTGGTPSESFRIDESGNVGIGMTPTARLSIRPSGSGSEDSHFGFGANRDTYISTSSTGTIIFRNGSERMRIDSSGNVGIGTSSPSTAVHASGKIRAQKSGQASAYVQLSADELTSNYAADIFVNDTGLTFKHNSGSRGFVFDQNGSERMRIDSSGKLLVGKTAYNADDIGVALHPTGTSWFSATSDYALGVNRNGTDGILINFLNDASACGNISCSGTSVSLNSASDQRLKENIADADDAGSKIDAIQVRQYDWKADGSHQDYGMIAQELLEVAPEAVHQPEDSEEMMGVDYSKLVPMLIKEIQSLRNRVAQLEE